MSGDSPVWCLLLTHAIRFAESRIARLHWRGSLGGILPDGFDASSIAAEAIALFLQQHPSPGGTDLSLVDVQKHLRRLVHRQIDRLHRRKENYLLRNEPDLAPIWLEDGEPISAFETIPDPASLPDQNLISAEAAADFERLKQRVTTWLDHDRPLKTMFLSLCDDISKPRDLAAHLRIPVTRIQTLQRRLRRRLSPILRPKMTNKKCSILNAQ
jgi:hypothetical protein